MFAERHILPQLQQCIDRYGRAGRKFDSVFVHGRFSSCVSFESAIDFSVQGA
ncbi:MAG: hypothetical protein ACLR8P_19865 [Clostridium fessum]